MELPENLQEVLREAAARLRDGGIASDDALREAVAALAEAAGVPAPAAKAEEPAAPGEPDATAKAEAPAEPPAPKKPAADDLAGWLGLLIANPQDREALDAVEFIELAAREASDWDRVVEALLGKLEIQPDSDGRVKVLREVAAIFENEVGDLSKAFATLLAAFREAYPDEALAGDLERLAGAVDLWGDLLAEYSQLAPTIKDPRRRCDEWLKIARLYRSELAQADGAIAALKQAQKLEPRSADVLGALAEALREARRWRDLGETLVAQAEAQVGGDRVAKLLEAAEVYETRADDVDQALACHQRVSELDGRNRDALAGLERIYRRRELWEPLARTLDRKLEGAGRDEALAIRLDLAGVCAQNLEDPQAAVEHARAALQIDPINHEALALLESLYEKLGRTEDYLGVLERRADLAEGAARVPLLLRLAAEWEEQKDGRGRAIEFLDKVLVVDDTHEEACRLLVHALRAEQRADDLVRALERYERVAKDAPNRREARADLGRLLEERGRRPEATAAWERILADEPDARDALVTVARLREEAADWTGAVRALERLAAQEQGPARADLHVRAGLLLRDRLGESGRAEEELVRAIEHDAKQVAARLALAELYRARGDVLRAAKMLADAAATSQNLLEKGRALVEAAELYDEARDRKRAAELLREALALDPEHVEAARRLASILEEEGRPGEARPLLELLRRKIDASDRRGSYDLHLRLARIAQSEERDADALAAYRTAYDIDPTSIDVLRALADLGERAGSVEDATKALQALLLKSGTLDLAERAPIYARLGALRRKAGDVDQAINFLEKAVDANAMDRASLEALAEMYRERSDFQAVVRVLRGLATLGDREDRYRCYMEAGELLADQLGDRVGAAEAIRMAAAARPKGFTPLHKLLDLATERRDWAEALDVLDRLAALEEDRERRSKYRYSAAVILRDELHDDDGAVERFEKCMEDDPARVKALQAIEKVLGGKGGWTELAHAYQRQIERLGETPESVEARVELWAKLGELRRAQLRDRKGAVLAFEEATRLDPDNVERRRRLTELYVELSGPMKLERAIPAAIAQLRMDPYQVEGWRLLRKLYDERGEPERSALVLQALGVFGCASDDEREALAVREVEEAARPKRRIDEEMYARCVRHPDEDPRISTIFAAIAPVAAAMTARPPAAFGLAAAKPVDVAADERPFVKALRDAAPVLGIAPPDLYVDAGARGLRPANPRRGGEMSPQESSGGRGSPQESSGGRGSPHGHSGGTSPQESSGGNGVGWRMALVAGVDVAYADADSEALFEAARGLALARPDHVLAWAVPFVPALRSLLWAAARLARADLDPPPGVEEVERVAEHLRKHLTADAAARVAEAAAGMVGGAEPDLARWLGAVELTAARAGLAVAGDLATAARIVASDPPGRYSLPARERVKELLVYSVSEEYFQLREHLAVEGGASGAPAS